MFALQQIKKGQRTGKVWMFASRKLAQESVIKTYDTHEPSGLMQTSFIVGVSYVRVDTTYMGTLYFTINEVFPSSEVIVLE